MGRRWKIAVAVLAAMLVLLGINALLVDDEAMPAAVTVPGGRILHLADGDLQILERGPRDASPIVLIHCYTCAIDWWDGMLPALERRHRVIAIDLRGFGGSEKPASGYSIPDQAKLVAEALQRLGAKQAEVVGHSLGGTVATALAEDSPRLVGQLVIVDQAPDQDFDSGGLPLTAKLTFIPVIGQGLWRITPDFEIKAGLGVAFAPGFDVPDRFVDDFRRINYASYRDSPEEEKDYSDAVPLNRRIARAGVPLLAIFGAEDQIYDSRKALAAYAKVPGARTVLIPGSGHSPNVEKPAQTARLVLGFAKSALKDLRSSGRDEAKRGPAPQRSSAGSSPNRASGVRSATGDQ
ncbi:MAG: alpha/beta fold hydrolase [Solirubrobacterales bacterium]|nr:alpha/beta fold hydrolase [Solirubrobacterales bacterium]